MMLYLKDTTSIIRYDMTVTALRINACLYLLYLYHKRFLLKVVKGIEGIKKEGQIKSEYSTNVSQLLYNRY